jgi:hypothetical protein
MIAGSEKALISSTKQKNSDFVFAVIFFILLYLCFLVALYNICHISAKPLGLVTELSKCQAFSIFKESLYINPIQN